MKHRYDTIVIGGGPAGLASAIKATKLGLKTLIIEKTECLGGIPLQCIHEGFGIIYFNQNLTGPEFSYKLIEEVDRLSIDYITSGYVSEINILSDKTKQVRVISPKGYQIFETKTLIYAAGAREKTLHEINVVGDRVSGIFTAGEAQTLMDIYGVMPGREVVIIGSGDVGLILTRRLILEKAKVKAVIEAMPYPGGLVRNIVQCLKDFDVLLLLGHVVKEVRGRKRVKKVVVERVNENLKPLGESFSITCDTVIISAGLLPRVKMLKELGVKIDPLTKGPIVNDLFETSIRGVFVAGNALVVNDLVDYVVEQGENAAEGAYSLITKDYKKHQNIPVLFNDNIRFIVPQRITKARDVVFYLRVKRPMKNIKIIFEEINRVFVFSKARPSEMIRVKIKKKDLVDVKDKLHIRLYSDAGPQA